MIFGTIVLIEPLTLDGIFEYCLIANDGGGVQTIGGQESAFLFFFLFFFFLFDFFDFLFLPPFAPSVTITPLVNLNNNGNPNNKRDIVKINKLALIDFEALAIY